MGKSATARMMRFVIRADAAREFRWTLYATNGKIIACSGEGYRRKQACVRAAERVMAGLRRAVRFRVIS